MVALICSVEARPSFFQSFTHLQSRTILRTYPVLQGWPVCPSVINWILPLAPQINYLPTTIHWKNHYYQELHRNSVGIILSTDSHSGFSFTPRATNQLSTYPIYISSGLPIHCTTSILRTYSTPTLEFCRIVTPHLVYPTVTHDRLFSPLDLPLDAFYIRQVYHGVVSSGLS